MDSRHRLITHNSSQRAFGVQWFPRKGNAPLSPVSDKRPSIRYIGSSLSFSLFSPSLSPCLCRSWWIDGLVLFLGCSVHHDRLLLPARPLVARHLFPWFLLVYFGLRWHSSTHADALEVDPENRENVVTTGLVVSLAALFWRLSALDAGRRAVRLRFSSSLSLRRLRSS